jgi:hypothetical protein
VTYGYYKGGRIAAYDAATSMRHFCQEPPDVPDIVLCLCGQTVYRYADGTKRDYPEGAAHDCHPENAPWRTGLHHGMQAPEDAGPPPGELRPSQAAPVTTELNAPDWLIPTE